MQTGFRFRGIHTDELELAVRTKSRPVLPEQKERTQESNSIDGVMDFSAAGGQEHPYYHERMFQSELLVTAEDIHDLQQRIGVVAAWLMGSGELIYDDMPYIVWHAKVVSGVDFAPQIYGLQAVLSVSFRVYTWSESSYDTEQLCNITLDEGITLDSNIPIGIDEFLSFHLVAGKNIVTVCNFGDVYVKPILRFTGQSENLTVQCGCDMLSYHQAFSSLDIDCDTQIAAENSTTHMEYVSGTFPELQPGDNTMTITVTGAVELFVLYTPQFIYHNTIIK